MTLRNSGMLVIDLSRRLREAWNRRQLGEATEHIQRVDGSNSLLHENENHGFNLIKEPSGHRHLNQVVQTQKHCQTAQETLNLELTATYQVLPKFHSTASKASYVVPEVAIATFLRIYGAIVGPQIRGLTLSARRRLVHSVPSAAGHDLSGRGSDRDKL